MSSFAVDKNRYDKLSDIEDSSDPLMDAAYSKSLEGHLQLPHGPPSSPSETLSSSDLIMRVVIAAIGMLFVFSVTKSILKVPQDAVILLASLEAPKFNISEGILDATWKADIIVKNPNAELKAYVSGIETWIYYTEPVNMLAHGLKDRFSLDPKSNTTITIKSSVSTKDQPQRWVVDDVEKERSGGSVNLGLKIRLVGDFTTGSFFSDNPMGTTVYCRDVKVVFPAGSTTGALANADKPQECSRYRW